MHLLEAKIFANALNIIPELGPVRLRQLFSGFGSYAKAWSATSKDYSRLGWPTQLIDRIIAKKSKINPEQSFAELARRQIEVLLDMEPSFPPLLKEITPAPPILYTRGDISALKAASISVVGTRKISIYGKQVCEELVAGLVQNKITIVSGLAFGVDAQALTACINNGGQAVAVLASDLDNLSISPKSNFQLAQKIINQGCLVSEYPLGSSVQKQNFPVRNRLISGLSMGTVVVEADLESGSLITANCALEQNREVFAVPGSIFSPTSRGTNELIRKGAHLVSGIGSILDELNIGADTMSEPIELEISEEEKIILSHLPKDPIHLEDLIRQVRLPAAVVNANITILEMKGRVRHLGMGRYAKIR